MDKIVKNVIDKFQERSDVGIEKYGVTLEREDLTTLQWINHAQEEAMDFCLYLERLKVQENRLKQLLTVKYGSTRWMRAIFCFKSFTPSARRGCDGRRCKSKCGQPCVVAL
jgi:hypothetical protein